MIGLSRFLIRPAVRCPHLASQVLGRRLRRRPADLEARYGLRVWRVERYADAGVQGTGLRAANFVCVGATKGRGRQDRYHRREKTGKTVWMYPLHRRWRRDLGVAEVERWPSLAPGEGLRAQEWAANELGGAPLGDRRWTARLVKSASLLAEDPGQKIQAHPDRSRTVIRAFYRWIEQPADSAITADHILAPHRERTLQRIRGQRTVLAIQDGSDRNFARRPGCDGLQVIGTNQTRASTLGLHLHATLAVTDTGLPLGVLRLGFDPLKKHAKTVAAGTKSRRWLHGFTDTVDAVREVGGKTRVITVCDREADFFERFDLQRQHPRVEVLVRARHDRVLGPHRPKRFAALQAGPPDDRIDIEIDGLTERRKSRGKPARPARRKRVAHCELRHRRLTLPSTLEGKDPVSVSTVHRVEIHPPEGENPVQGFLLTTLPVRTGPHAAEVVGHDLQRWKIEDFFRVLKSGCQVQFLRFRKAERLQRATAIHAVIAWRIMVLTLLGRPVPDCAPTLMFTDPELAFLRDYAREQAMPAPDPLGAAVRLVAHLGGYRDRKHDPEPGHQIMWHGSNRLSSATLGHRIGFQAGQRQALVRDRTSLVQP